MRLLCLKFYCFRGRKVKTLSCYLEIQTAQDCTWEAPEAWALGLPGARHRPGGRRACLLSGGRGGRSTAIAQKVGKWFLFFFFCRYGRRSYVLRQDRHCSCGRRMIVLPWVQAAEPCLRAGLWLRKRKRFFFFCRRQRSYALSRECGTWGEAADALSCSV